MGPDQAGRTRRELLRLKPRFKSGFSLLQECMCHLHVDSQYLAAQLLAVRRMTESWDAVTFLCHE